MAAKQVPEFLNLQLQNQMISKVGGFQGDREFRDDTYFLLEIMRRFGFVNLIKKVKTDGDKI